MRKIIRHPKLVSGSLLISKSLLNFEGIPDAPSGNALGVQAPE